MGLRLQRAAVKSYSSPLSSDSWPLSLNWTSRTGNPLGNFSLGMPVSSQEIKGDNVSSVYCMQAIYTNMQSVYCTRRRPKYFVLHEWMSARILLPSTDWVLKNAKLWIMNLLFDKDQRNHWEQLIRQGSGTEYSFTSWCFTKRMHQLCYKSIMNWWEPK